MTLKEKFDNAFVSDSRFDSENAEIIADNYVIEFTEWMNKTENRLGYHEAKNKWYHFYSGKWITTSELLEIFKKEKEVEWYNEEKVDERIKIVGQNGNSGEHYDL
jgi:hypothetical protein